MSSLGVTRYELLGLNLNLKEDLNKIPKFLKRNIDLLYFSIDGHIGFPHQIGNLNFKYIFFEGHVNTSIEENIKKLVENSWLISEKFSIEYSSYISDGDSGNDLIF